MNMSILQYWEESERGREVRPDGASLHSDITSYKFYIESIYGNRGESVPDEYDRIVGDPIIVDVSDAIFEILKEEKNLRLAQYELTNLIKMEEIIC